MDALIIRPHPLVFYIGLLVWQCIFRRGHESAEFWGIQGDITSLFPFISVEASATVNWKNTFFSNSTHEKTVHSLFQGETLIPLFFNIYFKSILTLYCH